MQQATVYGGIESVRLHRLGAECVFDSKAAEKTGYREVRIAFAIDDDIWREVVNTAMIVFRGCPLVYTGGVAAEEVAAARSRRHEPIEQL